MKPAAFDYVAARSIDEALDTLAGREAKVLAGGQSLVPLLNLRLARPSVLIDLGAVDGLERIERANGHIVFGPMTRPATN